MIEFNKYFLNFIPKLVNLEIYSTPQGKHKSRWTAYYQSGIHNIWSTLDRKDSKVMTIYYTIVPKFNTYFEHYKDI